jgi:hypothetical protein
MRTDIVCLHDQLWACCWETGSLFPLTVFLAPKGQHHAMTFLL